ncbi:glycosyltransferase family 4 protein [Mucilaginibacter sp. BJC16-A38]|uniref:glycosyltransferase family 4 protein n=1 Tax=Mucilaginibacter phenanthrenivorans TaxID=1234842 RepID=UPI0021579BEF|nr:glycosyltransferase family 4 protein [Mucilaginibacter phenanthrenivorans]MCR8559736.1 glycosyltransferase family 4 protein [Mucilaginibacter phenanthrenivorans]
MNVMVIGTRGIPNIQGGVETHCEELYSHLVQQHDIKVTIIRRSAYTINSRNLRNYKGITLKTLYSPKNKSFEAIVHTFLAVVYAGIKRPDILHIHAVGPSLFTPFARILGLKVIMTHHGPDYERKKWGVTAKAFLKMGELAGVKFANKVIVISKGIGESIQKKYGRKTYELIHNGVPEAIRNNQVEYLSELGIEPQKYIFTLGRFVPEKGFDYLIEAYKKSKVANDYKLVIAGEADHETEYSKQLRQMAQKEGIILTGFIKNGKLHQLYTHARLFVLPSFYEGLPIALLEAMSYGLDILASDIPANKEVCLKDQFYFATGNVNGLAGQLEQKLSQPARSNVYELQSYDWGTISKQTYNIYKQLIVR